MTEERIGLIQRLRLKLTVRRIRSSPEYAEAYRLFGLALHRGETPEKAAETIRGVFWSVPEPFLSFIVGDVGGRFLEDRE